MEEFRYGEIPTIPEGIDDPDDRDLDRAFFRTNPYGPTQERWFHEFGCRRWFTVTRDTSTDEIVRDER